MSNQLSNKRIVWPEGAITRYTPASAAVYDLEIWNRRTVVDLNPAEAGTINLTIDPETPDGADLFINVNQGATGRNITLGAGIEGDDLVGVANDKDTLHLVYNKTAGTFRVVSNQKTVDAA